METESKGSGEKNQNGAKKSKLDQLYTLLAYARRKADQVTRIYEHNIRTAFPKQSFFTTSL